MKTLRISLCCLAYALVFHTAPVVAAPDTADWQPITTKESLRSFISGARLEINLTDSAKGEVAYFADGTGHVEAWNGTFQRNWALKGDDQICFSSGDHRRCVYLEQSRSNPQKFRFIDVATGKTRSVRVIDMEARRFVTETGPEDARDPAGPSASEIAAELSDPNTSIGTLNMRFLYNAFEGDIPGADNAEAWSMLFQPSLPYALSESANLFIRPAIPIVFDQDVPQSGGEFKSEGVELGDIGFDTSYARTFSNGTILIGGLTGTLPTATEDSLGREQWLLGPNGAIAVMREWGVLGVLVSHQWDVAGEDDFDTSVTGGQYFYTINLDDGWQITANPTFSYNHEARNNDELTFPVATGIAKTVFLAGRPWKFGVQYWHYLESPDSFGPDYTVMFTVSPVVKLPW